MSQPEAVSHLKMYRKGCRCLPCRSAYCDYRNFRARERARGRRKDNVSTVHVKPILEGFESCYRAAKMIGINASTVSRILSGSVKKIRVDTEQKILRVAA